MKTRQQIEMLLRTHWHELVLFFSAILLQAAIFFLTARYGEGGFLWSSDAEWYFDLTKNLLTHRGFYLQYEWGQQALRTPLFPLFTAALHGIFSSLYWVIAVQNVLAALTVVLVYRFGRHLFGAHVGFFGSVLFLIESQRLQVANQLMSETLFLLLFIGSLLFFFRGGPGIPKTRDIIASGVLFGLSSLTRPVVQYLPLFLGAVVMFQAVRMHQFKRGTVQVILFVGVFLAVIFPWLLRNKIQFNQFKLSSAGGTTLYYADAVRLLEYKEKLRGNREEFFDDLTAKLIRDLDLPDLQQRLALHPESWKQESVRLMEFKYEPYFIQESFRLFRENILLYVGLKIWRNGVFLIESSLSRSLGALLHGIRIPEGVLYPYVFWLGRGFYVCLWFFSIISMFLHRHVIRQKLWILMPTLLIVEYFALLSDMNFDAPRMRLPINPLLFLTFAYFLHLFYHKFSVKWKELRRFRSR